MRAFFNAYLSILKVKDEGKENAGILIDSTGLSNSIHFSLTAVSNHNGVISEEVRLIYVVQQNTRLITTLKELKAHGVSTKFAILDIRNMTAEGVKHLYDDGISFITRCPTNRSIYRQALTAGLKDLEAPENVARNMTAEGVKHLYDDGISFITRCPTNRSIYRQALTAGLKDLEAPENVATDEFGRLFNGRQV